MHAYEKRKRRKGCMVEEGKKTNYQPRILQACPQSLLVMEWTGVALYFSIPRNRIHTHTQVPHSIYFND